MSLAILSVLNAFYKVCGTNTNIIFTAYKLNDAIFQVFSEISKYQATKFFSEFVCIINAESYSLNYVSS